MIGLLEGVSVIDLTTSSGWDCGRMLSSFGAAVTRVDTPDALARLRSDPRGLTAWRLGQIGKSPVTLDYQAKHGREALLDLIDRSDVVLESFAPGEMAALDLSYEQLSRRRPGLILTSITPFGQSGPYSAFKGGELVVSAMSSLLELNGDPDRPPVREPGSAHLFHACAAGLTATVIALHERARSGRGQWIDISAQEVGASRNTAWILAAQFDGRAARRRGPYLNLGRTGEGNRTIWRLKDGYAAWQLMPRQSPQGQAFVRWMEDLGFAGPGPEGSPEPDDRKAWEATMAAFMSERTRAEIMTEGPAHGCDVVALKAPDELVDDPQFRDRNFFGPPDPSLPGSPRLPTYFIRATPGGQPAAPPAPRPARPAPPPGHAPLAGLRILDFSWAIVGSVTTKVLADLGAEVVKIETLKLSRQRLNITVKVPDPTDRDANPWYANWNTSKRSLRLDLTKPGSRAVLDGLIDWADVVFENFAPGVMDRLGVGWDALRSRRPDIIMASGSIFGQTGPYGRYPGNDASGAAQSGRMYMTGWPDRDPVLPSAPYGDMLLPYFLAPAIVAAVDRRDRTGQGCRIDASMAEVLVQQMLPDVVAAQQAPQTPSRRANREPGAAPHGVFPCAGDDRWIAITVFSDGEWKGLCDVLGGEGLADDPRFSDLAGRLRHEDALEAALASRTITWEAGPLMKALQAAGVPAGVVQSVEEVLRHDPQLADRGFMRAVDHPVLGAFDHVVPPMRFSRTSAELRPAPRFGEHSREVCRDILGLDDAAIADLEAAGVLS